MTQKHENYEILNLIGYGLSKFNMDFVEAFNLASKSEFYNFIVHHGIADTVGTVKNRQDLFDPFFDNGRKGWWQKGDAYIHRLHSIDAFFGSLDANEYADVVKIQMHENYAVKDVLPAKAISPVRKSQFKQLQQTGHSAELFFIKNYQNISLFTNGNLEDARMLGDGYDFQISVGEQFFLAEIKGIHEKTGAFRMTSNEFEKAKEYENSYALVIVANLGDLPTMKPFLHPVSCFEFSKKETQSRQLSYHAKFTK